MTTASRRKTFYLCLLPFFVLAIAILVRPFCLSTPVYPITEEEHLEGLTPSELFEIHKNNPAVLPPKDIEKAREIVRNCEELWAELQSFKDEPGFSTSHLAEGTQHHDWLLRAQALNRSLPPKEEIGSEVHSLPGWLIGAGFDLSGQHQIPGWKSSIEERFIKYQISVAKKAVHSTP